MFFRRNHADNTGRRLPELVGIQGLLALSLVLLVGGQALGDELLLADAQLWPGEIFTTDGHRPERRIYRLNVEKRPKAPSSVPRIAGIAAIRADEIYFCSGMDGRIQRVNRESGATEVVYTHDGLVRDLAIHPKSEELYFSHVATPERGEPLTGGGVYRLDRKSGKSDLVYEADQAALGSSWLGALAFAEGRLHLATQGVPARVVRVDGKDVTTIFKTADFRIHGLAFSDERLLLFAGDGRLLEVADGEHVREVTTFSHNFTNLTVLRLRQGAEER